MKEIGVHGICAKRALASLFLVLAIVTGRPARAGEESIIVKENPVSYRVRIDVEVRNQNSKWPRVATVILPTAIETPYQDVVYRNHPGEASRFVGEDDGEIRLVVEYLKPGEKKSFHSEFDVTFYDFYADLSKIDQLHPYDEDSELYKRYTRADAPYLLPENPAIVEAAEKLSAEAKDILEYARAALSHVNDNFSYTTSQNSDLNDIIKRKTGNCVGRNAVFISLLRSKGIPARYVVGQRFGDSIGHAHSEFYLQGYGWIPADAANTMRGGTISEMFGKVRIFSEPKKWKHMLVLRHTDGFILPLDEYGFVSAKWVSGHPTIQSFGREVSSSVNRTVVLLKDGEPDGSASRITLW